MHSVKRTEESPILCPTVDEIHEHLYFKSVLLLCKEDDKRAENTIEHLKLNKDEIINFRIALLKKALEYRNKSATDKACFKELIFIEKTYPTFRNYLISIVNGVSTHEDCKEVLLMLNEFSKK